MIYKVPKAYNQKPSVAADPEWRGPDTIAAADAARPAPPVEAQSDDEEDAEDKSPPPVFLSRRPEASMDALEAPAGTGLRLPEAVVNVPDCRPATAAPALAMAPSVFQAAAAEAAAALTVADKSIEAGQRAAEFEDFMDSDGSGSVMVEATLRPWGPGSGLQRGLAPRAPSQEQQQQHHEQQTKRSLSPTTEAALASGAPPLRSAFQQYSVHGMPSAAPAPMPLTFGQILCRASQGLQLSPEMAALLAAASQASTQIAASRAPSGKFPPRASASPLDHSPPRPRSRSPPDYRPRSPGRGGLEALQLRQQADAVAVATIRQQEDRQRRDEQQRQQQRRLEVARRERAGAAAVGPGSSRLLKALPLLSQFQSFSAVISHLDAVTSVSPPRLRSPSPPPPRVANLPRFPFSEAAAARAARAPEAAPVDTACSASPQRAPLRTASTAGPAVSARRPAPAAAPPPPAARRANSAPREWRRPSAAGQSVEQPVHHRLFAAAREKAAVRDTLGNPGSAVAAVVAAAAYGGSSVPDWLMERERRSQQLSEGRIERVTQRLYADATERAARRAEAAAAAAAPRRQRTAAGSSPGRGGASAREWERPRSAGADERYWAAGGFLERQEHYQKLREARLRQQELEAERARQQEFAENCTFAPAINPSSAQLQRTVDELHAWDARRQIATYLAVAEKEESAYEGVTFKPAINPRSRQMALRNWAVRPDPRHPWTTAPAVVAPQAVRQYVPTEWKRDGSPTTRATDYVRSLMETTMGTGSRGSSQHLQGTWEHEAHGGGWITPAAAGGAASSAASGAGDGAGRSAGGEGGGEGRGEEPERPPSSGGGPAPVASGDGVAFVHINLPNLIARHSTASESAPSVAEHAQTDSGERMSPPATDAGARISSSDEAAADTGSPVLDERDSDSGKPARSKRLAVAEALRALLESGISLQPTLSDAVRAALALAESEAARAAPQQLPQVSEPQQLEASQPPKLPPVQLPQLLRPQLLASAAAADLATVVAASLTATAAADLTAMQQQIVPAYYIASPLLPSALSAAGSAGGNGKAQAEGQAGVGGVDLTATPPYSPTRRVSKAGLVVARPQPQPQPLPPPSPALGPALQQTAARPQADDATSRAAAEAALLPLPVLPKLQEALSQEECEEHPAAGAGAEVGEASSEAAAGSQDTAAAVELPEATSLMAACDSPADGCPGDALAAAAAVADEQSLSALEARTVQYELTEAIQEAAAALLAASPDTATAAAAIAAVAEARAHSRASNNAPIASPFADAAAKDSVPATWDEEAQVSSRVPMTSCDLESPTPCKEKGGKPLKAKAKAKAKAAALGAARSLQALLFGSSTQTTPQASPRDGSGSPEPACKTH